METLRTAKKERFGSIDRTNVVRGAWCVVRGADASPIRGAVVLSWVELGQRDVSAGGASMTRWSWSLWWWWLVVPLAVNCVACLMIIDCLDCMLQWVDHLAVDSASTLARW